MVIHYVGSDLWNGEVVSHLSYLSMLRYNVGEGSTNIYASRSMAGAGIAENADSRSAIVRLGFSQTLPAVSPDLLFTEA